MIWMDDSAAYHTSKFTTKVCQKAGLRMIWPAQFPYLNPIENLWRLIKIRISDRRHQIRTVGEMKDAIKEE